MGGAVTPLPQYAFMASCSVRGSTGTTLPFTFYMIVFRFYVEFARKHDFLLCSLVLAISPLHFGNFFTTLVQRVCRIAGVFSDTCSRRNYNVASYYVIKCQVLLK
jgi:uncharacterized membrane protein